MIIFLAIILDIIFSYYGINSLFVFSSVFILKKEYFFKIFIIGIALELFYINNYYFTYLLICSVIIKNIYKIITQKNSYDLVLLYIITFFYNFLLMLGSNNYNYKNALLISLLPCLFYIFYKYIKKFLKHKLKYENNKQIINSSYFYPMRTYWFKKK